MARNRLFDKIFPKRRSLDEFGENLQALRRRQGLSQEQLAEKLSVTRQTISKWERNQSTPDLNYLCELSGIFGISLDALIKARGSRKTVRCRGMLSLGTKESGC